MSDTATTLVITLVGCALVVVVTFGSSLVDLLAAAALLAAGTVKRGPRG